MSKEETFSNSVDLVLMNDSHKGALIKISEVVGNVYHVACWSVH